MRAWIAVVVALLAGVPFASSRRTTRPGLEPLPVPELADSMQAPEFILRGVPGDSVRVAVKGYDKPLRSRQESFFAVNTDSVDVDALMLTITYYDMADMMLHSARHRLSGPVPAGETRRMSVRSWDSQNAFYYYRSDVPSRAVRATPYKVTITVDSVFVAQ